ncbi:hypothetical protein CHUAL_005469 [Chamberlinius hualienensis]
MEYQFFLVNAFTNGPYSGNGAGVCLLPKQQSEIDDNLRQKLATEINLSETAFVTSYTEESDFQKESEFGLRWFTPKTEVPLCGHATLASAAVLLYHIGNRNSKVTFDTLSGPLVVEKGAEDHQIRMKMPWRDTVAVNTETNPQELIKAAVGNLPVKDVRLCPKGKMILIRLDDSVTRKQFENFHPVPSELTSAYSGPDIIGVIVTMKGSADNGCVDGNGHVYDFVSRFFAPWSGIAEDPVTGSAHAILGPYWADILNKRQMFVCQCSKRKGELWLQVDEQKFFTAVSGQFFTYVKGHVRFQ